jgi:hypothetical protein
MRTQRVSVSLLFGLFSVGGLVGACGGGGGGPEKVCTPGTTQVFF